MIFKVSQLILVSGTIFSFSTLGMLANAAETAESSEQAAAPAQTIEQRITTCESCHGPDGNAPIDPTYPVIAGQYEDYLVQALLEYRDGDRSNILMAPQAADLSDREIKVLSAYFAEKESNLKVLEHDK